MSITKKLLKTTKKWLKITKNSRSMNTLLLYIKISWKTKKIPFPREI